VGRTGHVDVRHRPGAGRQGHRDREGPDQRRLRPCRQQAEKAEDIANEHANLAAEAKKEQEKAVKAAERAAVKQAKEQAREPYENLTKAELADILAERELPKSGTVEELIERLVSADSE